MKNKIKHIFNLQVVLCLMTWSTYAQSFGTGNLVVYRVGEGATPLSPSATPAFLDEYTIDGVHVTTVALPVVTLASNKIMTASGTTLLEGFLTRTTDKRYLMMAGYDAEVGTAAVTATTSALVNRVIGRMDAFFNLDATTALTDYASGASPRSVCSSDGNNIWICSESDGIKHTTLSSVTSTQISNASTNIRVTNIFGGQLYVSSAEGSFGIAKVGTGTPMITGQAITNLPGLPTSGGSPNAFFFADLNINEPGLDVLYVADDVAGIIKYSLISGTWVNNGTVSKSASGITGLVSGESVTLFTTCSCSSINTITDSSGHNGTFTGTQRILVAAAPNTVFRGIAFSPETNPLPVKLEYIKGQKANFGNVLNWKVTCLSTNIVMEIERSTETKNFKSVTSIPATQARCSQPFDFTDAQPLKGRNFYRLKMIDIDGKTSYSPVVLIINGSKGIEFVGLYPSLIINFAMLSVSSAKATNIETRITDINGRLIKTFKKAIPPGSSLITINCAGLAPGIYNLTGIAQDASTKTIQFIKQ